MTKRVSVCGSRLACAMALVVAASTGLAGVAVAEQAPEPLPPPPPPAPEAVPPPPGAESGVLYPSAPEAAVPAGTGTDHDGVVGTWGIEARRVTTVERTLGQELGCVNTCPFDLNALSLRRWVSPNYAWSLGLVLGVGGGSSRLAGQVLTWDTYFGAGPTVGANFLLANWQHLAVSMSPQLDLVFFVPSSKGSKTVLLNLRGVVEGEIHLGMIGLPAASVALSTGIAASYLHASKDTKPTADPTGGGKTASKWGLSITGPQSLWDVVTQMTLRYYF
jgi:hypothetical protein